MEQKKRLRSGFTTGTCGAAAAMAAARALLGKEREETVSLMTPGGREAVFDVLWEQENRDVWGESCAVRKDAGDDPDVTNGTLVYACVSFAEEVEKKEGEQAFSFVYRNQEEEPELFLAGGKGVGRVRKKGLKCPVGYPAVNPVPQQMIFDAVRSVCREFDCRLPLYITISIPEGEKLALKTFNPRLGIEGGISVLGTTGIVNPMSEEALLETIRLEIRVQAVGNSRLLAVAPGNYGEAFLREELGLSMDAFVRCSNFIGNTFQMLKEEGIKEVLFAGHLGKLIKVAGGVMNTHSKYGDRRMEILSDCGREALGDEGWEKELKDRILSMNTTDEAADFLAKEGILSSVMAVVTGRIQAVLERKFQIRTEVIVFSGSAGILGMTKGAREFAKRLKQVKRER